MRRLCGGRPGPARREAGAGRRTYREGGMAEAVELTAGGRAVRYVLRAAPDRNVAVWRWDLAGEVRRSHAAKEIHPSIQFLLYTNIACIKNVLRKWPRSIGKSCQRWGALLTLSEGSSQEAGHELFL